MTAFRSLLFFWRESLAVLLGTAVASTVLTGALLAGDSVRGSLRDLTLERLGRIDLALVSEGFFREKLAEDLGGAAPALAARGSAVHGGSQARASRVEIWGVDDRFAKLYGARGGELGFTTGQIFPPLVVNETLARELGARTGDEVLLSFGTASEIPRETLLGEKDPGELLTTRRFTVARVIPDRGIGRFGLAAHQQRPRNAFVPLAELQRALEQEGRANALFAADGAKLPRRIVQLEDLGLTLRRGPGVVVLESREFFLKPAAIEAAGALAKEMGVPAQRVLTYLATRLEARGRLVPYSLVAAVDASGARPGEILLDRWAADDLGVVPGEPIALTWLAPGPGGTLLDKKATLRLGGIVEMSGLAVDRTLTPRLAGVDEAEDMAGWDPPFPVDLSLIRPRDEAFWDEHGPTPKAFVAEETGRRLWSSRFGDTTSLRFAIPPGADPARLEERILRELPQRIDLAAFGLQLRPVKQQGLEAAEGATDFAGLFLAFSVFLIASAAMLAGLLFSLGVERRAGELGLLLAVGHPVRAVRRRLLLEGAVLAAVGALLGLAGAVGYAALLMAGLRTLWLSAVGTPDLFLHVEPSSLIVGWLSSVLVVLLAIWLTVRRLAKIPSTALLAGSTSLPVARKVRRRWPVWVLTGTGVLLVAWGLLSREASPGLSFALGAWALVAGLVAFSGWYRRGTLTPLAPLSHPHSLPPGEGGKKRFSLPSPGGLGVRMGEGPGVRGLLGMAARNGAANPGRSLLSVALVACACFVLVVVAANRRGGAVHGEEGGGGFPLLAESDIPLLHDLDRPEGRMELGLMEDELQGASIVSFRAVPGEDASCLNLYRPSRPRLLGVPSGFAERSRFSFQEGSWGLLEKDLGPNVIPAVADAGSAQWILHLGLGDDLVLESETGAPVRLRLVGLLGKSIFQSELLISEANLLRHFPSRAGSSFFLIGAPASRETQIARVLEEGLQDYGFDVTTTAERMASFQAVEETYLATFQTLGGLGLLLGTLGLGVALLRGVTERRGELATLRAFGFRRRRLAGLVTAENAFLLFAGVALGTVAGGLAVAPHLLSSADRISWPSLLLTLLAILAAGLLSCVAAVRSALRAPLLPALKAER